MRVLVVDDSAFHRLTLAGQLRAIPGVRSVEVVASGPEAIRRLVSDGGEPFGLVTLDVVMPGMDGLAVLRWILEEKPLPVLVISAKGRERVALEALELGAFDVLAKPTTRELPAFGPRLAAAVAEAVALNRSLLGRGRTAATKATRTGPPVLVPVPVPAGPRSRDGAACLVIAASTGGPAAIRTLLERLGTRPVAVAIAQHMPPEFTRSFARRLDGLAGWRAREAAGGDRAEPGLVLVSPGNAHLRLAPAAGGAVCRLEPPSDARTWTPSADLLLASAATTFGPRAIAVVLTGMGTDGAEGAAAVAGAGGTVFCESDETALVDGMPAAAARAVPGAPRLPLAALADTLARLL